MKCHVLVMLPLCWAGLAFGQQDVGYVSNSDVSINGVPTASRGQTILGPSSALETSERPARVVLSRGGMLTVCQSSAVHLEIGHGARSTLKPIHLSLDTGSMEILTLNTASDSVMAASGVYVVPVVPNHEQTGVLHLAMGIGGDGHTCIENRSSQSPLNLTDSTGSNSYVLKPGQRAVFANGSLKDISSSDIASCGCPPIVADGGRNGDIARQTGRGKGGNSDQNGSSFPFPMAESQNAPEPEVLDAARIQSSNLHDYDPAMVLAELNAVFGSPDRTKTDFPANVLAPPAPEVLPRAAPSIPPARQMEERDSRKGFFAAIGRFFARLFP